jgi:Flp pilus assembly protein TadG
MHSARHEQNQGFRRLASTEASQLLEFAIALPLLVVLVVGIFDFGDAYNLKHQLENATRDAARFGASIPISDATSGVAVPASIDGAWQVFDAYLTRAQINDCGLGSASPAIGVTYTWTSTANSSPCVGTLTLKIERAYMMQVPVNSVTTDILCTRVSTTYPYPWHFNRVIQLLVPGSTYGATLQVAADAVMPNME